MQEHLLMINVHIYKEKSEKKYKTEKSVPKESILGKKESVFSPHKLIQHDWVPLLGDPKEAQTKARPFLHLHKPRQTQPGTQEEPPLLRSPMSPSHRADVTHLKCRAKSF